MGWVQANQYRSNWECAVLPKQWSYGNLRLGCKSACDSLKSLHTILCNHDWLKWRKGTNTGAIWSVQCCPSNGLVALGGKDVN